MPDNVRGELDSSAACCNRRLVVCLFVATEQVIVVRHIQSPDAIRLVTAHPIAFTPRPLPCGELGWVGQGACRRIRFRQSGIVPGSYLSAQPTRPR
jgi:hypothetical protein